MDTDALIAQTIQDAQAGDEVAKNGLVLMMRDNGCMKSVSRYLYKNRLVEPDEVRGEFWLGVVMALPKVKLDIGNPLKYLTYKGINQIKNKLRTELQRGVQQVCLNCGHSEKLNRYKEGYCCSKCWSTDIDTAQREINITTLTHNNVDSEIHISITASSNCTTTIDIKEELPNLSKQEQMVLMMMLDGINSEEFNGNYLKEIGKRLGVSPQCVSQYVKRIRRKLAHLR